MTQRFRLLIRNCGASPREIGIEPYGDYFDLRKEEEKAYWFEVNPNGEASIILELSEDKTIVLGSLAK